MEEEKKWYALYTKPRWEKKIDASLIKKNIESWCPLQKMEKQWTDRKKIIEEPLFKSYIFVHIDLTEKVRVLQTDGILKSLKEGYYVIATRYYFSSIAYNASNTEDFNWISQLNSNFPQPDILIYIDVPVDFSLERISKRKSLEIYEKRENTNPNH